MTTFIVSCPCPCGVRFPVDSETMRPVNYLKRVEVTNVVCHDPYHPEWCEHEPEPAA
jgi:hypothetical protein